MNEKKKETKAGFIKFRVTPAFKKEIENLRDAIPYYQHFDLQDFIVLLIKKGIEIEHIDSSNHLEELNDRNKKEGKIKTG